MNTINEIILDSSENLRGHIPFEEYQKNILSAIFYKFLSYKIEKENNKKLFKYDLNFQEAFNEENFDFYGKKIKNDNLKIFKYFIHPDNLYRNIINEENKIEKLNEAINNIELNDDNLKDLLKTQTINRNQEIREYYESILLDINTIKFNKEEITFLMKYFFKNSFTPRNISLLLSKLALTDKNNYIKNAYDATCGSCSTLLTLNELEKVDNFYGQEIKKDSFDLARMNMIMNNISPEQFQIFNEDSTTSKRKLPPMDVIISHPPFLKKWDAHEELLNDERFNSFKKLPSKSKASFAFLGTMIYQLKEDGIMVVVMPQGVLFRTNAEKEIRKTLIEEKNYIDAVIGLPERSFPKNISTCILVLKKNRNKDDKILFINSTKNYDKNDLNNLTFGNINDIVNTYQNKLEIDKYSHNASLEEIRENDYNLNIKRYVNTYNEKEKINIRHTIEEIELIEKEIILLREKEKSLLEKIDIELEN